jgi:hypothetical protein
MSTRIQLLLVALIAFLLGGLLAQNLPLARAQNKPEIKSPVWQHGMNVKCRSAKEETFVEARKVGIEVYRDENNGNLIYISETGSIAVVQGGK